LKSAGRTEAGASGGATKRIREDNTATFVFPPVGELPPAPETDGDLDRALRARLKDLEDQLARAKLASVEQAEVREQAVQAREVEVQAKFSDLADALHERGKESHDHRALLSQYHSRWERDHPKPLHWPPGTVYNPQNLEAFIQAEALKASGVRPGPNHQGFGGGGSHYLGLNTGKRPALQTHDDFFDQSLNSGARAAEEARRTESFAMGKFISSTPRLPKVRLAEEADVAEFLSESSGDEDASGGGPGSGQGGGAFDRMTDAITALIQSNQSSRPSGYSAKNPPWSFPKLSTDSNGGCKALVYHTWKERVKQSVVKLRIDEEAALMALQQDHKVLTKPLQALIMNCDNLEMVWRRLDENFPHIETTENELLEAIVCRAECPNDPSLQILHCDALMSAIEIKCRVHPHHFINRTHAMATLGSFKDLDLTNTMIRIDGEAGRGVPYEKSLYDFAVDFRRSKMDIQNARGLFILGKERLDRSSHLSMSAGPRGREKAPASGGSFPKKDFSGYTCPLCNLIGHSKWFCPDLEAISQGKKRLPKDWCPKCVAPKKNPADPTAPHPVDCHMYYDRKDKEKKSNLCVDHKDPLVHRKLCKGCAIKRADRAPSNLVIKNEK
jgi:hypothetical protein